MRKHLIIYLTDAWLILKMMTFSWKKYSFRTISHRILSPQNRPDFYSFNVAMEKKIRLASLGNKSITPLQYGPQNDLSGFLCSVFLAFYICSIYSYLRALLGSIVHRSKKILRRWNLEALTYISVCTLLLLVLMMIKLSWKQNHST